MTRDEMLHQIIDLIRHPNRIDRYIRQTDVIDEWYSTDAEMYLSNAHAVCDHYVYVPKWDGLPDEIDVESEAKRLMAELDDKIDSCPQCGGTIEIKIYSRNVSDWEFEDLSWWSKTFSTEGNFSVFRDGEHIKLRAFQYGLPIGEIIGTVHDGRFVTGESE